jgi:hypothetical protein
MATSNARELASTSRGQLVSDGRASALPTVHDMRMLHAAESMSPGGYSTSTSPISIPFDGLPLERGQASRPGRAECSFFRRGLAKSSQPTDLLTVRRTASCFRTHRHNIGAVSDWALHEACHALRDQAWFWTPYATLSLFSKPCAPLSSWK